MTSLEAPVRPSYPPGEEGGDLLEILLIEDGLVDATMVRATLADELGARQHCTWARTLADGIAHLADATPSCVLLDLGLPDSDGLETLQAVLSATPDVPVVVFTGLNDDQAGQAAVADGAQDYLVKGRTDAGLLVRSIHYAIARKQVETMRRSAEERLRSVVDGMLDPLFILVAVRGGAGEIVDFTCSYANVAACKLVGLAIDQVSGRRLFEVVPAQHDHLMAACVRVVDSGVPSSGEWSYAGRLGGRDEVAVDLDLRLVRFGDGCVVSARDITAEITALRTLEHSEARFRALIENSTDVVLVCDVDGRLLYASPSVRLGFGYAPDDLIGTSSFDLVHPDDLLEAKAALASASEEPGPPPPSTFRIRDASGSWRWIEVVSNSRLDEPAVKGIVMNVRDVSEHRREAQAILDMNSILQMLHAADNAILYAVGEQDLFDKMCDLIVEFGGYSCAWIAAADPDHPDGFMPVTYRGDDEGFIAAISGASGGALSGPAIGVARRGETQVVQDTAELPADMPLRQVYLDHGCRSLIGLPLRVEGDVVGVLAVHSHEPDAFARDEVEILERLAADLGYGTTAMRTRVDRERYAGQLEHSVQSIVDTIARAVEYRDPYTAGHQRRVASLSAAIGHELDLDLDTIAGVAMSAEIHDIGKMSVPAEILSKPTRLSAAEFEIIKQHSQVGYEIVKEVRFSWPVPEMILQHHERLDGSGYPSGLKADEILLGSRILAVADTVEAMISHRPYRPGLGIDVALAQIEHDRGRLFDADVVDACLRLFRERGFVFGNT